MSRTPTFILSPNMRLTFSPDGPYFPYLGNIISDPLSPTTRILSKLVSTPTDAITVLEKDNAYTTTKASSFNASIWATFVQSFSARLSGSKSDNITVKYTMDELRTLYFEPSDTEIAQRAKEARV